MEENLGSFCQVVKGGIVDLLLAMWLLVFSNCSTSLWTTTSATLEHCFDCEWCC